MNKKNLNYKTLPYTTMECHGQTFFVWLSLLISNNTRDFCFCHLIYPTRTISYTKLHNQVFFRSAILDTLAFELAQQRLYFLRQLRKFNLLQELLIQFYSAIIESVVCTSITVWFSSATKSDLRRLRRVVRTAERIIGTTLPTLQELYSSRVSKRAGKITLDPSHPAHSLFALLPSGWRYRALSTRTTRHRNSFFPQAIHLMNTWH